MKKLVLVLMVSFFAANLFAYTYGYVVMRGKKADSLDENLQMMSLHVKNWANGEILLQHKQKKGILFFKKHIYTVFFKGPADEVRDLLKRSPWEGDILKDIAVKVSITTYPMTDDKRTSPVSTDVFKYFPNPLQAFRYFDSSNEKKVMRMFAQKDNAAYKKHVKYGKSREITFTFYSTRPSEKNRIITLLLK